MSEQLDTQEIKFCFVCITVIRRVCAINYETDNEQVRKVVLFSVRSGIPDEALTGNKNWWEAEVVKPSLV